MILSIWCISRSKLQQRRPGHAGDAFHGVTRSRLVRGHTYTHSRRPAKATPTRADLSRPHPPAQTCQGHTHPHRPVKATPTPTRADLRTRARKRANTSADAHPPTHTHSWRHLCCVQSHMRSTTASGAGLPAGPLSYGPRQTVAHWQVGGPCH